MSLAIALGLVFALSPLAGGMLDLSAAVMAVQLCAKTYCPPSSYDRLNFSGPLLGFHLTLPLAEPSQDTRGFIGTHAGAARIFVVFRGSEDIRNWLSDLDLKRSPYTLCDGCFVHEGFIAAADAVYTTVKNETLRLLTANPGFGVTVAGHSLGAALATLTATALARDGINATLINFGSPRVGNAAASRRISELLLQRSRVTHLRDVVVHTPPVSLGYEHISGEYYDSGSGVRECGGSEPEDKSCADQWQFETLSFADHLHYLNVSLWCPAEP